MYCCVVGKIVELDLKTVVVEDLKSKEKFICILDGDESLEVAVGEEGVFAGKVRNGDFVVRRVDIRKFLDPLFEEDMLRTAGLTTLIAPIEDPFPEMYLRFKALEEQRLADEQKEKEAAEQAEESLSITDNEEGEDSLERGPEEVQQEEG